VTYALAGTVLKDLMTEPIGRGKNDENVWIGDIWPSAQEIQDCMKYAMDPKTFQKLYSNLADANPMWTKVPSVSGQVYTWPNRLTSPSRPSSRISRCSRLSSAIAESAGRAHRRIADRH